MADFTASPPPDQARQAEPPSLTTGDRSTRRAGPSTVPARGKWGEGVCPQPSGGQTGLHRGARERERKRRVLFRDEVAGQGGGGEGGGSGVTGPMTKQ